MTMKITHVGDDTTFKSKQKTETCSRFFIARSKKQSEMFDIQESYSFNTSPSERKIIRKIIFQHFDYIVLKWNEFHKE